MAEAKIARQDALFRRVAAEHGNIMTLLDSFFGFLKRNTDFYIVNDDPASTVGFPRGTAERLTLSAFRKYAAVDVTPSPVQSAPDRNKKSERAVTVEVEEQPASHIGGDGAPHLPGSSSAECSSLPPNRSSKPFSTQQISENEPAPTKVHAAEVGVYSGTRSRVMKSGLDILDDLRKTMKASSRKSSEGGHLQVPLANGGIAATYWWEQNLKGVVLHVPVRPQTRAKNISFHVTTTTLSIAALVDGCEPDAHHVQGTFCAPVRHSDAVWAIDPETGILTAEFEKIKEGWWNCMFKGDACIDTTLIDSTQEISEYDEVTQGEIRRVMYQQQQARLRKNH